MYYKIINDRTVFSNCKTIQTEDGTGISNPTEEQIAEEGGQIYVAPPVIPEPQTEPGYDDIINAVKKMFQTSAENLSDKEALEIAALYPTGYSKIDNLVSVGERLGYDGKLYKVVQSHTVQLDGTPDISSSLYVEISIEEIPDGIQPISAETAYNLGDKVKHNDKTGESDYNANVGEPGVYGWHKI